MYVGSDSLQALIMARRLSLLNRQIEEQRKDPTVETKSFKDIIEKDEIQMSGGFESIAVNKTQSLTTANHDNLTDGISELSLLLEQAKDQALFKKSTLR
jgi:hypothetical protein